MTYPATLTVLQVANDRPLANTWWARLFTADVKALNRAEKSLLEACPSRYIAGHVPRWPFSLFLPCPLPATHCFSATPSCSNTTSSSRRTYMHVTMRRW